ncbi:MAG: OmpA family protein [Planctomycetota bacterium]
MKIINISILAAGAFLVFPACATRGELAKEQQSRRNAEEARDNATRYSTELQEENRRLAAEVRRLGDELADRTRSTADAAAERQKYLEKRNDLEKRLAELGNAPENASGDVSVFYTPEGTVVEIKEGVLFDSGKKDIKDRGREILDQIAASIVSTNYNIRIDGHTDADPVKVHAKEFPNGNLQLSSERAVEVAGFFMKRSKSPIPEGRIAVAGFGPNRPKVEGRTPEIKKQNRRVDIVILDAAAGSINITKPAGEDK